MENDEIVKMRDAIKLADKSYSSPLGYSIPLDSLSCILWQLVRTNLLLCEIALRLEKK